MQNFYVPPEQFDDNTITITGDEYRHATRACRVRIGDIIGVTDGCGRRFEARITAIDSSILSAVTVNDISGRGEPTRHLTAALAVIKPSQFELAVEKCTELGVRCFLPVITRRTETRPERLNHDRLARIALEAAKQSGRSWVPVIEQPVPLMEIFEHVTGDVFVALASAEESMETALARVPANGSLTILVGPEGDFTDEERDVLLTGGAVPVSLGGLVLRAETAMIAAAALCAVRG